MNAYICYGIVAAFVFWAVYIQFIAWRRTKGFRGTMEMSLVDRVHDEVTYQIGYKRGYWIDWDVDANGYWKIKASSCPRTLVKILKWWSFIQVALFPYSFRTNRKPDFDDFDKKYTKDGAEDGKDNPDNGTDT